MQYKQYDPPEKFSRSPWTHRNVDLIMVKIGQKNIYALCTQKAFSKYGEEQWFSTFKADGFVETK